MIYLDNSATTPVFPEVMEAMEPYLRDQFGNASSIYSIGSAARNVLEESRETVAKMIGARSSEIVFTSSGTEANNFAIKGSYFANLRSGAESHHFITSSGEHHAVLEPMEYIAGLGAELDVLNVNSSGQVEMDRLERSLRKNTTLVSFMLVNNEVGAINDIKKISQFVKSHSSALVHTDAVQALGKLDINVRTLDVDMLTLSAHKINGPKGIGALFIKRGTEIDPLIHGGAQERNRRAGTEPVHLAVGFAKACEIWTRNRDMFRENISKGHHQLISGLRKIDGVRINSGEGGIETITNFTFASDLLNKIEGDTLIIHFDLNGIAVSNGSACTSGSMQPSHVLVAMGKGNEVAGKSIRVSLSSQTTSGEIEEFLSVLEKFIAKLYEVNR